MELLKKYRENIFNSVEHTICFLQKDIFRRRGCVSLRVDVGVWYTF